MLNGISTSSYASYLTNFRVLLLFVWVLKFQSCRGLFYSSLVPKYQLLPSFLLQPNSEFYKAPIFAFYVAQELQLTPYFLLITHYIFLNFILLLFKLILLIDLLLRTWVLNWVIQSDFDFLTSFSYPPLIFLSLSFFFLFPLLTTLISKKIAYLLDTAYSWDLKVIFELVLFYFLAQLYFHLLTRLFWSFGSAGFDGMILKGFCLMVISWM